jgi:hypothetical protein
VDDRFDDRLTDAVIVIDADLGLLGDLCDALYMADIITQEHENYRRGPSQWIEAGRSETKMLENQLTTKLKFEGREKRVRGEEEL